MKSNQFLFFILTTILGVTATADFHQIEIRTHQPNPITLATMNDFSSARFEGKEGDQKLLVTLNEKAAGKVDYWTTHHVGDPLDFVVDGSVLRSPAVRAPIKDGHLQMDRIDRHEAEIISRALDEGPTL